MTATPPAGVARDMTRHLGEGGMPLLGQLGTTFTAATVGQSAGTWQPTGLACNPRGTVQGGVFGVVLDAAMSLAVHSLLPTHEAVVSVQLQTSQPLPAWRDAPLAVNAEVVRLGGTMVFAVATITGPHDETVAFANGTFVRRPRPAATT